MTRIARRFSRTAWHCCAEVPKPGTGGRNLSTRSPCFGQTSLAVWRLEKGFPGRGFRKVMLAADAGDIGLSKGPRMQSTPTLKDTDPHDVFAIESLLAAHAEKAPPLAYDPAPSLANAAAAPHVHAAAKSHVHVAPAISVVASTPQIEPTFRAPDLGNIQLERGMQVEDVGPGEIKVDGLELPGERPQAKWVKRLVMVLLGLCGAVAAAAWQHYGDQATAVAAEWAPPFVLAALSAPDKAASASQPHTLKFRPPGPRFRRLRPIQPPHNRPRRRRPAEPGTSRGYATDASAESAELQTMTQDLAAMGQQVEELKATITELKASQAQMARELAKASGGKAAATKPSRTRARRCRLRRGRPFRHPSANLSRHIRRRRSPPRLPRRCRLCRLQHRCRLHRRGKRWQTMASRWCGRRCRCGSISVDGCSQRVAQARGARSAQDGDLGVSRCSSANGWRSSPNQISAPPP